MSEGASQKVRNNSVHYSKGADDSDVHDFALYNYSIVTQYYDSCYYEHLRPFQNTSE